MTDKRVDEIFDKYISTCRKRLDNAYDTGSAGEVYTVACDIILEFVKEIIRLESELECWCPIKEVGND